MKMIGQILISCLVDTLILLWFNKKYNSPRGISNVAFCWFLMTVGVLFINRYNNGMLISRILFSFIVHILLFTLITAKREPKKIVLRAIILISCSLIAEFTVSLFMMIAVRINDLEKLMGNIVFWFISIIVARSIEIVFLNLSQKFLESKSLKIEELKWHIIGFFLILSYFYIVLSCFVQNKITYSVLGIAFLSNIVFAFLLFGVCFVYLNIKKQMRDKEKEIELLKEKGKIHVDYYREVSYFQKQINKLYHDLKNHILIANQLNSEKLKGEYTESLERYFSEFQVKVNSGNEILDILLRKKIEECERKKIDLKLHVNFSKGSFVNLVDVSIIFGNVLDNAIEACERITDEKKWIELFVDEYEDFIYIKISNPFLVVKKEKGRLMSLKNDDEKHGLGLECLEDTLQKYGGTCIYTTEQSVFKLTAIIPIRQ